MDDLNQIDRVTVQPGDRFVVRVPGKYTHSAHDNIRAHVAFSLGVDVDHVLVLEDDMTLAAVSTLDERRVPDLLDANNRYHDRNVALSSALLTAVRQFRFYEAQHRAKGTPDADRKADVNQMLAHRLEGVAVAQGTVPSAWFAFGLAHQLAVNLHGMLEAHMANVGEPLEADDGALVAEWVRQLDMIGQMALDEAPEGALTIALAEPHRAVARLVSVARVVAYEDQSQPALKALDEALEAFADGVEWNDTPEGAEISKPYKATAQTEAGSIAAGGSALVGAFMHANGLGADDDRVDVKAMLDSFAAFAVDHLKARTLGADFQITDAPKPSDGVVSVHVDFDRGGGVQAIRREPSDITATGDTRDARKMCKGDKRLGTACGDCPRCDADAAK